MIIYIDIISGKEVGSDSYKSESIMKGIVMGLESKKISIGVGDIDIGANASAEGGEEEADDTVQQVINIVHTHQLTNITLEKKEAKAFFKTYWKAGNAKLQGMYYEAIGLGEDWKAPKDKDKAKAAIAEALEELDEDETEAAEAIKKQGGKFKKNFDKIKKWIKENVMGNFDEYEFYIPQGAELGQCCIIPARYVGEAATPTFYYFMDLIEQSKE